MRKACAKHFTHDHLLDALVILQGVFSPAAEGVLTMVRSMLSAAQRGRHFS